MGNYQSDDEDDGDDSDKDMGVETEDGDEADSLKLQKLAARVGILYFILFKDVGSSFISLLNLHRLCLKEIPRE